MNVLMADTQKFCDDRQKYVDDHRIACKYGTKCYQKNPFHQAKYKHPPLKKHITTDLENNPKRIKTDSNVNKDTEIINNKGTEISNYRDTEITDNEDTEITDNEDTEITGKKDTDKLDNIEKAKELEQLNINTDKINNAIYQNDTNTDTIAAEKKMSNTRTPKQFDPKDFIKQKFLVEMPPDFYAFWDFCKTLKPNAPQDALKDVGLILVGAFDVLAGKFYDIVEPSDDKYLIHWRYFYDPPELQTVIKGDKAGFHIGYFRDSSDNLPVFLACNCAKNDGILQVVGDNIFAAVSLYLDDLKRTGDPFKKMQIIKFQGIIKKRAEELKLDLSEKSQKIINRDRKIVTRSFSKMGIVVPYDKKTQTGYRNLGITNKELTKTLTNIQNALPEQRPKFLSDLQSVMTNASIATDECDFGTGIELGLNILAHGVESLNVTIARFLASNYRLIGREAFAKIVEAHMKNRRKETNLSII